MHRLVPEDVSIPPRCRVQTKTKLNAFLDAAADAHPKLTVFISGLCGRPKNSRTELSVTMSHVFAIYQAILSPSTNPYALIMEDDISMPFDIDWKELLGTAPKDFAILQLVTSNGFLSNKLWAQNIAGMEKFSLLPRDGKTLWLRRRKIDFWCAGAYIVHRDRIKGRIMEIIKEVRIAKIIFFVARADAMSILYYYSLAKYIYTIRTL